MAMQMNHITLKHQKANHRCWAMIHKDNKRLITNIIESNKNKWLRDKLPDKIKGRKRLKKS